MWVNVYYNDNMQRGAWGKCYMLSCARDLIILNFELKTGR